MFNSFFPQFVLNSTTDSQDKRSIYNRQAQRSDEVLVNGYRDIGNCLYVEYWQLPAFVQNTRR